MNNLMRSYLVGAIALGCATGAPAENASHISADALKALRLPDVALERVAEGGTNHFATVDGVIGGNIRFELLLPDTWNGRFVMGGGGGFVGTVQNSARGYVYGGYATVGTDTGHEWQPGYSAGWAYTNMEAQVNFAYLAVHRTAEVAKALVRAYYGKDAEYSYFTGCSRGGGQAMMESQRYPKDFDGIVAGAPAFDWPGLAANGVTIQKALYPNPERLVQTTLDRAALVKLQQAILEQCDAKDGLKDGIVEDPPSAHFDLAKAAGLTDEQRAALGVIYGGVKNDKGVIYPGYTPGAEVDPDQWILWIVGPVPPFAKDHAADLLFAFGTEIFKYLVFDKPDWDYAKYDFSNFQDDTRLAASYLDATNADLSGLKARNGKLILWHGWADPALPPQATINYYLEVQAHDPGASDYCRLFMVPGCLHCGGGPGASEVDWLKVIADWVERGKAPDRIIAAKSEGGRLELTRPLFCYPTAAAYDGSGDPAKAESFVARKTSP